MCNEEMVNQAGDFGFIHLATGAVDFGLRLTKQWLETGAQLIYQTGDTRYLGYCFGIINFAGETLTAPAQDNLIVDGFFSC